MSDFLLVRFRGSLKLCRACRACTCWTRAWSMLLSKTRGPKDRVSTRKVYSGTTAHYKGDTRNHGL